MIPYSLSFFSNYSIPPLTTSEYGGQYQQNWTHRRSPVHIMFLHLTKSGQKRENHSRRILSVQSQLLCTWDNIYLLRGVQVPKCKKISKSHLIRDIREHSVRTESQATGVPHGPSDRCPEEQSMLSWCSKSPYQWAGVESFSLPLTLENSGPKLKIRERKGNAGEMQGKIFTGQFPVWCNTSWEA